MESKTGIIKSKRISFEVLTCKSDQLTKNPDTLSVLIDGLMPEVKRNFQMIGVNFTSIHLKPLDNSEFHSLLKGEAKNGVDVLT